MAPRPRPTVPAPKGSHSGSLGVFMPGMPSMDRLKYRRIQTGAFLNLQRIQRRVERSMQELFAKRGLEGVTPAQANALMILFEQGGSVTAGQLATRMSLSPVTVGRFVHALEAAGWMEREPHPTDSRALLLKPTVKAFDALPTFISVANEMLDVAFAGFEEEEVLRLARKIGDIQRNLTEASAPINRAP